MVDVGSHHFLKAAGGGDRVLVPQPSDDPHDPLVSESRGITMEEEEEKMDEEGKNGDEDGARKTKG